MGYLARLVDQELDAFMPHVTAVTLDGPKGVGKTSTASRRAVDELRLDPEQHWRMTRVDPKLVTRLSKPLLVDEWQWVPVVWDVVHRAVDDGTDPGSFLLAGSASPCLEAPIHSGAGRILSLRIQSMALYERDLVEPSVSMAALLRGGAEVSGTNPMGVSDYLEEILASGFPGLHRFPLRVWTAQPRSYTTWISECELPNERGVLIRCPASLMGWLSVYASTVSTTATWKTIRTAATPGGADSPTKVTVSRYCGWLTSLWLLDPAPAWRPLGTSLRNLVQAPKRHLADPTLTAVLLRITPEILAKGQGRWLGSRGLLAGGFFENLATLTARGAAQVSGGDVFHLRTKHGEQEVDLIVEGKDGRIVAFEIKLNQAALGRDVRHLLWLREKLGDQVADLVLLSTGEHAYRRPDGVAVVPLVPLGS